MSSPSLRRPARSLVRARRAVGRQRQQREVGRVVVIAQVEDLGKPVPVQSLVPGAVVALRVEQRTRRRADRSQRPLAGGDRPSSAQAVCDAVLSPRPFHAGRRRSAGLAPAAVRVLVRQQPVDAPRHARAMSNRRPRSPSAPARCRRDSWRPSGRTSCRRLLLAQTNSTPRRRPVRRLDPQCASASSARLVMSTCSGRSSRCDRRTE